MDANGNYQSQSAAMSGSDAVLKDWESTFQQDLNSDGTIGGGLVGGGSSNNGSWDSRPQQSADVSGTDDQPSQLAVGVQFSTLGSSEAVTSLLANDAATGTFTLLTNYMASAFPTAALSGPVADAQSASVEEFLTKPLS